MYPDAKFIHIHRNPLNVVASLVEGRVMAKHSVKGAVNYWLEAMILVHEYKKIGEDRLIELPYESLVKNPDPELSRLCAFIKEDCSLLGMDLIQTHDEQNNYKRILTEEEQHYVLDRTASFRSLYGYSA